jgi:hypothetical protein
MQASSHGDSVGSTGARPQNAWLLGLLLHDAVNQQKERMGHPCAAGCRSFQPEKIGAGDSAPQKNLAEKMIFQHCHRSGIDDFWVASIEQMVDAETMRHEAKMNQLRASKRLAALRRKYALECVQRE